MLGSSPPMLTGSGAAALAAEARLLGMEPALVETPAAPEIVLVARLGAIADPAHALPKPLYLRGPDAKPQDQVRLPRQ